MGAAGLKAILRYIRQPRKLILVGIGSIALLGGATGAFALYGGAEMLRLEPSPSLNGLACTDVQSFDIRKKDRYWVRKFIRTESTDGLTRVRTALRVAQAVYAKEKPDLVQVVVLDAKGPDVRSDMRGRAVGADVVFVPDPEKLAGITETVRYTAKYADGMANDAGQFFGARIDVPPAQIEHLVKLLSDSENCAPAVDGGAAIAKASGGHDTSGGQNAAAKPQAH